MVRATCCGRINGKTIDELPARLFEAIDRSRCKLVHIKIMAEYNTDDPYGAIGTNHRSAIDPCTGYINVYLL